MKKHEKVNYIEMASKDLIKTRVFFEKVFSWKFTNFSDEYIAFYNEGIDGGFYQKKDDIKNNSILLVLLSNNLTDSKKRVKKENGIINKDIFSFPGGKRFHFIEPGGNEFSIWQKDE
ncbi:MAG: VOC family protein [Campylobacteraceae bacterium]|nr:VOC family protein [Campylobacteraceae bacterium]